MNIQRRIINLFKRHPRHFIGAISSSYPLSHEQITKYQDKLLWKQSKYGLFSNGVSSNTNLIWSFELIDTFISKIDLNSISSEIIGQCLWFNNLLEDYEEYINWEYLSWNSYIPWTLELLTKYENKLDWIALSCASKIPWNKELLDKFEDKLNLSIFILNHSSPISKDYQYQFKRTDFSNPMSADDVISFMEKHEDKFEWEELLWDWQKELNKIQTDRIIDIVMEHVPVLEWPEA